MVVQVLHLIQHNPRHMEAQQCQRLTQTLIVAQQGLAFPLASLMDLPQLSRHLPTVEQQDQLQQPLILTVVQHSAAPIPMEVHRLAVVHLILTPIHLFQIMSPCITLKDIKMTPYY